MNEFIALNALLGLFYILHRIFLREVPAFHTNRFLLLAYPLLAAFIVYFRIPSSEPLLFQGALLLAMEVNSTMASGVSIINWAMVIYALGCAISLVVLLRTTILIWMNMNGGVGRAYSFFSKIQIDESIQGKEREHILSHELVHSQEGHSFDVMFYALLRCLFWLNPAVHLLMREVQLNHEFLADRRQAHNPAYQKTLLNELFNTQAFSLVNSFFSQPTIKHRLTMLSNTPTKFKSKMRYALLIPVLFVSVWMISCEKAVTQVPTAEVDQLPEFPEGNEGLVAFFQKDFEYPEELKSENIEGRVILSFVVGADGSISKLKAVQSDHPKLEQPAIEFMSKMPKWEPATKDGEKVAVEMKLPVMYTMSDD